ESFPGVQFLALRQLRHAGKTKRSGGVVRTVTQDQESPGSSRGRVRPCFRQADWQFPARFLPSGVDLRRRCHRERRNQATSTETSCLNHVIDKGGNKSEKSEHYRAFGRSCLPLDRCERLFRDEGRSNERGVQCGVCRKARA